MGGDANGDGEDPQANSLREPSACAFRTCREPFCTAWLQNSCANSHPRACIATGRWGRQGRQGRQTSWDLVAALSPCLSPGPRAAAKRLLPPPPPQPLLPPSVNPGKRGRSLPQAPLKAQRESEMRLLTHGSSGRSDSDAGKSRFSWLSPAGTPPGRPAGEVPGRTEDHWRECHRRPHVHPGRCPAGRQRTWELMQGSQHAVPGPPSAAQGRPPVAARGVAGLGLISKFERVLHHLRGGGAGWRRAPGACDPDHRPRKGLSSLLGCKVRWWGDACLPRFFVIVVGAVSTVP